MQSPCGCFNLGVHERIKFYVARHQKRSAVHGRACDNQKQMNGNKLPEKEEKSFFDWFDFGKKKKEECEVGNGGIEETVLEEGHLLDTKNSSSLVLHAVVESLDSEDRSEVREGAKQVPCDKDKTLESVKLLRDNSSLKELPDKLPVRTLPMPPTSRSKTPSDSSSVKSISQAPKISALSGTSSVISSNPPACSLERTTSIASSASSDGIVDTGVDLITNTAKNVAEDVDEVFEKAKKTFSLFEGEATNFAKRWV